MNYVYHMQNLTAGALNTDCLRQYPDTPYMCLMSPHMQSFVQTAYFTFNSKYDAW